MSKKFTFSQAVAGFDLYARARRRSPNTLATYHQTFNKFQAWLESSDDLPADPPISDINHTHIQAFFADQEELSDQSLRIQHINLSSLWRWAAEEGIAKFIMSRVERPKGTSRKIVPFTQADVAQLMAYVDKSKIYTRPGKKACQNSQPNGLRNRLIILLLLDTGLRISELTGLKLHNLDTRNQKIKFTGKGNKERSIPYSDRTARYLWRYMTAVRADARMGEALFVSDDGAPLTRSGVQRFLERLAERAGIQDVHPHRFRHTFAIEYLRNGGDIYTLQEILGHSTLDMVRKYLHIAQVDIDAAHRRASPVDNWRL